MKLATYADGSRDGHLVVVSEDLAQAHYAGPLASRLQTALDDWNFLSPQLHELAITLDNGRARHAMTFEPRLCRAPLPRPPRCVRVHTSAGSGPAEAAGAVLRATEVPAWFEGPGRILAQARPDRIGRGPQPEPEGPDLEEAPMLLDPHWAVVCADLPAGAEPARAIEAVRLVGWAVRAVPAARPAPLAGEADGDEAAALPWCFAPVLAAWARDGLRDGQLRLEGHAARALRGPAPGLAPSELAAAVAAAAATAPLPAGTVLLLPMPLPSGWGPVAAQPGRALKLAWLDAAGHEGFGSVGGEARAAAAPAAGGDGDDGGDGGGGGGGAD